MDSARPVTFCFQNITHPGKCSGSDDANKESYSVVCAYVCDRNMLFDCVGIWKIHGMALSKHLLCTPLLLLSLMTVGMGARFSLSWRSTAIVFLCHLFSLVLCTNVVVFSNHRDAHAQLYHVHCDIYWPWHGPYLLKLCMGVDAQIQVYHCGCPQPTRLFDMNVCCCNEREIDCSLCFTNHQQRFIWGCPHSQSARIESSVPVWIAVLTNKISVYLMVKTLTISGPWPRRQSL